MKAVFSTLPINDSHPTTSEFLSHIEDLIDHPVVSNLHNYSQHLNTSRFQHSLNVAYYAFLFGRRFNINISDCVRGAFLHDLFLYNWRTEQVTPGKHVNVHPQEALKNAKMITRVSPVMEDVIVNHMWPLGNSKPKSKEAWIVQASDKLCAVMEVTQQLKSKSLHHNLAGVMLGLLLFFR
ncbi:MAG TPA: HD domain-containing protein [Erysipelotrichaceae bacterium]|nr:HD domain-containing protein [Erysipelotrichaceae bacterium]